LDFSRIGVVVGLTAEAKIVRRRFPMIEIGGGTSAGAEAAAQRLIERGAQGLLSFGLAGGLDPALRPGALVVPEAVLTRSGPIPTSSELTSELGTPSSLRVLGGEHIVTSAIQKQALWLTTGCAAVDLESAPVALTALSHRLPFGVLRAICDPAERDLPSAALSALNDQGAIGFLRVIGAVLAGPGQIPTLIALARDAAAARRTLIACLAQATGEVSRLPRF